MQLGLVDGGDNGSGWAGGDQEGYISFVGFGWGLTRYW